jgi:hypothetical protein
LVDADLFTVLPLGGTRLAANRLFRNILGLNCAWANECSPVKVKTIVVNDKMQKGYCYTLAAPTGRDFDPEFAPELTPKVCSTSAFSVGNT